MPSRQERRKAERAAAKRAPSPGQAGASTAAGAAAAIANLNVNVDPGGDWTTQEKDPSILLGALPTHIMKQRAAAGDRAAQFSQGFHLVSEADLAAGQGLTLVPISAQLELFCPPFNPASLMNVSWSCSS